MTHSRRQGVIAAVAFAVFLALVGTATMVVVSPMIDRQDVSHSTVPAPLTGDPDQQPAALPVIGDDGLNAIADRTDYPTATSDPYSTDTTNGDPYATWPDGNDNQGDELYPGGSAITAPDATTATTSPNTSTYIEPVPTTRPSEPVPGSYTTTTRPPTTTTRPPTTIRQTTTTRPPTTRPPTTRPPATTTTQAPDPVTISAPVLSGIGGVNAAVYWFRPSTGGDHISGYQLRRNGVVIANLGANQTTFADTNVEPGQEYTYSVRALSADTRKATHSPWSTPKTIRIP